MRIDLQVQHLRFRPGEGHFPLDRQRDILSKRLAGSKRVVREGEALKELERLLALRTDGPASAVLQPLPVHPMEPYRIKSVELRGQGCPPDGCPPDDRRLQAIEEASAIYLHSGVRTMERGIVSAGRDGKTGKQNSPALELVRLTIPRRVYTQSHMDYVADKIGELHRMRGRISGLAVAWEPPAGSLRFFLMRFTPSAAKLIGYRPPRTACGSQIAEREEAALHTDNGKSMSPGIGMFQGGADHGTNHCSFPDDRRSGSPRRRCGRRFIPGDRTRLSLFRL